MHTTTILRRLQARLLIATCAVALSLAIGAPPAALADSEASEPHDDELIVRLAPGTTSIDELNESLGTSTIEQYNGDGATYLLKTPPGTDAAALSEALAHDSRLVFAEANAVGSAPEANPRAIGGWGGLDPAPMFVQPALSQIRLAEAHEVSRGAGVTVAIIDTGAQIDHPALRDYIAPESYDFIDDDAMPADDPDGLDNDGDGLADEAYGHGTHVAGIVHTVAPDAKLLILRVLTAEGNGEVFDVAEAITYAVSQGATVINLSLGTSEDTRLLSDSVRRATRAGVVVVASAGNEGAEHRQYPAASSCAIAVTSVNQDDVRSTFANYGDWIGVSAPGESIFNSFPTDGYATWSGTSMATPFVAGQAALIQTIQPTLDVGNIADIIGGTARSTDGTNPDYDNLLGDGRIDLATSVYAAIFRDYPDAHYARLSKSCVTAYNGD
jgi:thermitase